MVSYQLTRARILRTAFARWDGVRLRHSGPVRDEEVRRKRTEYRTRSRAGSGCWPANT